MPKNVFLLKNRRALEASPQEPLASGGWVQTSPDHIGFRRLQTPATAP